MSSLFSTLAIVAFATAATAQDCDHPIDLQDTFGDSWNGAALDVINNTNGANTVLGLDHVTGNQTTHIVSAASGDVIDTAYTNGTFDAENTYSVFGGDGSVGAFPVACNLLGSSGPSPVGLVGLVGDCAGAGACPPPPPVLPANDDCSGAIDIGGGYQFLAFDMSNATDGAAIDYIGSCDFGAFGDEIVHTDIWYTFTPDNDGCHYLSTLNNAGFDTRIAVHNSGGMCPVDGSTVIACVDDEIQPIVGPFEAGMDVNLNAGTTYHIQLGTFQGVVPAAGILIIDDGTAGAAPFGDAADFNDPGGVNLANPTGCPVVSILFPEFCFGDGGIFVSGFGGGGGGFFCTPCPCGNNAPVGTLGGCLNSAGTSADLRPSGTTSVSAANLRFEMSGGPPSVSGVLTSGNAQAPANMANPCFGTAGGILSMSLDGLRGVVQGVLRHGVRATDANGEIGVTTNGWGSPNNFFQFGVFAPGDTRFFQVIYRDDIGAVCSTGQNTSEGVTVTFVP